MCVQCVAAGSAYAVPALVGLRVWSKRRSDRATPDVPGVSEHDDLAVDDGDVLRMP